MKILYVSNGSNFEGAGGMEYHLIDITDWLSRRGVETALAVRKGTFLHRRKHEGVKNVYSLSWTGFGKIKSFFDVAKSVFDFVPDIISINRERDIVRILLIVKVLGPFLKKRPKMVSVFHNVGWKTPPFVFSCLDGVIYPNNYLRDLYVRGRSAAAVTMSVIHHGIAIPNVDAPLKFDPHRKRKHFKDRGFPIIGMVGELRKNQTELVDVAYHLKRQLPDFTIAIVGRGKEDEINRLQDKIDRLGLTKHFIFTGNVDRSAIPDIFFDFDISVTTNRSEPFGIVFIESLAACTPLVAYDSGGPVEVLQRGGGILVTGGPKEMAGHLFRLVSDHEARKAMGLAGRTAAEKYFSIDAMGEKHYDFYRRLLDRMETG
jgi:glycosyltransferase involved in cell wall biosynthesis